SSDPSDATHFNGVYLARLRGIGPLFFDTQRVEINKGPQGTLRGRNATGGTINIISNRPEVDDFYGYVQGGIGNFNSREFEGVINLPVSDTFAVRGAVWTQAHDGLYTNEFLPDLDDTDFTTPSSKDDVAYRISALWEPNDQLSAYFLASRTDVNSSGDPGTFSGRMLAAGFDVDDIDDPWNQYFRTEGDFDQIVDTFVGNVNYEFTDLGIGVEYLGAYNSLEAYNSNASREWQLGMVYPGSEVGADFIASGQNPQRNLLVNDTFSQGENSDSFIQEIRLYSANDSRLTWTAGGFYFKEKYDFVSWDYNNGFCGDSDFFGREAPLGPQTISCWQDGLGGENRGDDSEVESLAFYGDATFDVSDRVRVKAGVRWTDEEKTQNDGNVGQYQFTFNEDFLAVNFGLNEPSDIIFLEDGFRLADAGARALPASVPAGANVADVFLAGVSSFGLGANIDRILGACVSVGACEVVITRSIFDDPTTPDVIELQATNQVSDSYVDWRIGAEFDLTPDNLLYATVSTGTRSGGINRPNVLSDGTVLSATWDPEVLTVYELGSKNEFEVGGLPVLANAAFFYYDFEDKTLQNLIDVPNPSPEDPTRTTQQVLTTNSTDAEVFGVELEGSVALPANVDFGGSLLYLDSELKNSDVLDPRSNISGLNIDGNELRNVSDWTINLRLSQEIPIEWRQVNTIDWNINMLYRSEYFLSEFNEKGYALGPNGETIEGDLSLLPLPNTNGVLNVGGVPDQNFYRETVDGFVVWNAVAGVNFGEDDQFRLDFFGENLTETAFSTKGFINQSVNIRYLNAPRRFGVRLMARF
ncbi:MAG: TonB-dependent receptor, partial [Caulobacterales bacterium]|nr:TonB-dependent receptor [Caulobacterales bacterium]